MLNKKKHNHLSYSILITFIHIFLYFFADGGIAVASVARSPHQSVIASGTRHQHRYSLRSSTTAVRTIETDFSPKKSSPVINDNKLRRSKRLASQRGRG